jgi:hypothetical protein
MRKEYSSTNCAGTTTCTHEGRKGGRGGGREGRKEERKGGERKKIKLTPSLHTCKKLTPNVS